VALAKEFFERKRLAKLGFTSSLDSVRSDKADAFLIIDQQIEALKNEALEKKQKPKGK
jgi:hypothetical protein